MGLKVSPVGLARWDRAGRAEPDSAEAVAQPPPQLESITLGRANDTAEGNHL